MKRKFILILTVISAVLVGCSSADNTSVKKEPAQQQEIVQQNEQNEEMTADKVKELVKPNIGEDDKVTNVKIEGKCVIVTVELGNPYPLTKKELAESRYSSISDELLKYDFWEVLTVKFKDVGEITMKSNKALDNGYGKYFDTIDFEKQLYK